MDMFFSDDLKNLSAKSLGIAHRFLGMGINYNVKVGYDIDQKSDDFGYAQRAGFGKMPMEHYY